MVARPALTQPFESVAFDLVGPLPKGKGGHRFILTYVCLATKWPEAVPVRSVSSSSWINAHYTSQWPVSPQKAIIIYQHDITNPYVANRFVRLVPRLEMLQVFTSPPLP